MSAFCRYSMNNVRKESWVLKHIFSFFPGNKHCHHVNDGLMLKKNKL